MTINSPTSLDIPSLRALWREAFFDGEAFLDVFFAEAFSPERCLYAAEGDKITAALYWFDCSYRGERVAYLYAVATAKAYRGRGICTALMQYAHKRLLELGYIGAILVPGNKELFSFYERLGYRAFGGINEFYSLPSEKNVELRRIKASEYAELRLGLLPEGSVIQENENLRFLEAQSDLYSGKDFILAARREGNTLFGIELLGDASIAPMILRSLDCAEGRFRTPGDEKPFAMYLALGEKKLFLPKYFGLAFD